MEITLGFILLLIFIGIPVLELIVLIEVGSEIGAINTIGLSFLTAGLGIALVRIQGLHMVSKVMTGQPMKEPLGAPIIHGFFLVIAGICLLIPGFITDAFGVLCLMPWFRLRVGSHLIKRLKENGGNFKTYRSSANSRGTAPSSSSQTIIEGDYTVVSSDDESDEPKSTTSKAGGADTATQIPPADKV